MDRNSTKMGELAPQIAQDLSLSLHKSHLGNPGSFLVPLKQPTKLPDQCRPYRHGDPVEYIDWKAFARTDQLIIREQKRQTNAVVLIQCDLRDTMEWPDNSLTKYIPGPIYKKSQLALRVSYHLAYLHARSSDHVYIKLILPNKEVGYIPQGSADILRGFSQLKKTDFDIQKILFSAPNWRRNRFDLEYRVTDLLTPMPASEVISKRSMNIHTLSRWEKETSWITSNACYFDESTQKKEYRGAFLTAKSKLDNALESWEAKLVNGCSASPLQSYVMVTENTPSGAYFSALRQFHSGVSTYVF